MIVRTFKLDENVFIPFIQLCAEFLIHGVKFIFPPIFGTWTRGIPTAYAAPSMNKLIVAGNDPIPVWQHGEGTHRGMELTPLHHCIPESVIKHPDLFFYDVFSLLDAIRSGRARERNIGIEKIATMLSSR